MDKKVLKITEDGSHTLFLPRFNETYHSIHGAIQESNHVFINAGLKIIKKKEINILEIGFGTGLNAFLTLLSSKNKKINYVALEAYPLSDEIISVLNYTKILDITKKETELFGNIHQSKWNRNELIKDNFKLKKLDIKLENFTTTTKFDLIYFDAFSPQIQPEMWEKSIFKKMFSFLNEKGILVTYCAKGSVKRALKSVGFIIENIPGPPGKREITRVKK